MRKMVAILFLFAGLFTLTACAGEELTAMNSIYKNAFGETITLQNGKASFETGNHVTYKGTYEYESDNKENLSITFTSSSDKNDPFNKYYVGGSFRFFISEDVLIMESSMMDEATHYYKETQSNK